MAPRKPSTPVAPPTVVKASVPAPERVVVVPPAPKAVLPPLPSWTDGPAIASYLTTIITAIFGIVTLVHPGFTEPSIVPAVIPAVALVVAAAAQLINVVFHRKAQIAAFLAATK